MKEYGKYPKVENLMQERRMSVKALAEVVGVPATTCYAKMAGESEISLALAIKIKNALNTDETVEALFATSPAV